MSSSTALMCNGSVSRFASRSATMSGRSACEKVRIVLDLRGECAEQYEDHHSEKLVGWRAAQADSYGHDRELAQQDHQ